MSKFAEDGLPCPCGTSSDAYAIDHEGRGFCFSCSEPQEKIERRLGIKGDRLTAKPKEEEIDDDVDVEYIYEAHRGLSKKTIEFYDIPIAVVNGEKFSYVFTHANDAVKTKRLNPKSRSDQYKWTGEANKAGLYGKDKFPAGSKKSIVITEGNHDAPSVYEASGGQVAAVSVGSASTAMRDIEFERDYVNSFEKIIICFDNDDAGKAATKKVMASGLFDFNKMYFMPLERKDANDYAQQNDLAGLSKALKAIRKYTPDNIISTFSEIEAALEESKEDCIGEYPTDRLNEMTYGLFRGQVIVVKGMEGIGKTEIFRMMENHLLKTTDCKLGVIHMEEDKATTIKGFATYELGVPCNLPDSGVSQKEVFEAYKRAVGEDESRVYLYTMFGGDDPDDILDSIRFLVTSGGVDVVFLDHITMLVTGVEEGDERRKLDYLSTKLKKMCKELNFCLVMITHVNDDGQTRGSRNISKIADIMIDLYRDKLSEDEYERSCLKLTIEKNRKSGRTGDAGTLYFNTDTFKLEEAR